MKKKILKLMLVFAVSIFTCACGPDANNKNESGNSSDNILENDNTNAPDNIDENQNNSEKNDETQNNIEKNEGNQNLETSNFDAIILSSMNARYIDSLKNINSQDAELAEELLKKQTFLFMDGSDAGYNILYDYTDKISQDVYNWIGQNMDYTKLYAKYLGFVPEEKWNTIFTIGYNAEKSLGAENEYLGNDFVELAGVVLSGEESIETINDLYEMYAMRNNIYYYYYIDAILNGTDPSQLGEFAKGKFIHDAITQLWNVIN